MSDTREVFEMVTKQAEPDLGSWKEQERHQRKRAQRRKVGAIAVVAALVVAGGVAFALQDEDPTGGVADQPTPTTTETMAVPFSDASAFLGFIDLTTGETSSIKIVPAGSGIDVSPDGSRFVYVDDMDGVEVLHIADIDGSNIRALEETHQADRPVGPRWSPDGSSIVYQGDGEGDSIGNLYVVDVGSGRTTRITDTDGTESQSLYYMSPTFDPTGTTVLFTMPTGEGEQQHWDLWSVPATGGEPTLVRRGAAAGDYSPDGSQIAFMDSTEGLFADVWVAPTAGGKGRKLGTAEDPVSRWSPDGTRIAYNDGAGGVHVVDVQTGEQTLVIESDRWPEWVDDDTLSLTP